jgi:hypothetical protein
MSETQIFQCPVSKNRLEFKYVKETVYCEYSFMDENLFKGYFVLLRNAIDTAIEKGYKKFMQLVSEMEYKDYLEDDIRWKIIDYTNNTLTIECDIKDALECIARGFGVKC